MAHLTRLVLGILILQIYVHAAPNDVSKIEDIAKVEQQDTEVHPEENVAEDDKNSTETQRQKRWYNPYGYGFPPINPLIYPTYNKRDESSNIGIYGGGDPLEHIHRRIQEIANIVRQPPPPPPPHIPIFYPVIFIPSGDCRCVENQQPTNPPVANNNETTPNITDRWPEMEDERQNWGFVVNETDDDTDFIRPISFDPIKPSKPTRRPPPPVDHGTVQSDSVDGSRPASSPNDLPSPPQNDALPSFDSRPPSTRRPPSTPSSLAPPSACDGAILSCCHQPQVIYDCFAIQGCPDFTAYGNPCDSNVILRVIERFQKYYGQRG